MRRGIRPALSGLSDNSSVPEAEGFPACSRWLSEARATPPVHRPTNIASRQGCQRAATFSVSPAALAAIPSGCEAFSFSIRWYRSSLAQPPATRSNPFGIQPALEAADQNNLHPLVQIWQTRLANAQTPD